MQVTVFPGKDGKRVLFVLLICSGTISVELITECRSHFYSIRSYKVRGLSSISVLVRLPRVRNVQRRLRINEEILENLETSVSQQSINKQTNISKVKFKFRKFELIDTFTDSQFEFTELDSPAFDISYPSSKLKYLLGYGLHIREDSNRRAITGSEKSSQGPCIRAYEPSTYTQDISCNNWLCIVPGDLLPLNTSNRHFRSSSLNDVLRSFPESRLDRRVIDTSAKLLIRSDFDCPETHRGYYIYWIPIEI
ncbi:hypothetical protein V1477_008633 [Vespula maculifrons]|uniref:Uncharacterized protein n=1 Tax=Vespula maculifrons TaxID=7453 RepID=A0ABD2CEJ2_VESMC